MSQDQWRRLDAVRRLRDGELTQAEAAQGLGLSVRHVRRLAKAIEKRGAEALFHGNAKRVPWNKTSEATVKKVESLMLEKYAGFNDQHFTEKLAEDEGLRLGRATVRRLLRAAGIAPTQKRRGPKLRRRRPRRAQEGLLLLWDGSKHDWLEGRGPYLCLMAAIDDATGKIMPGAHFCHEEGSIGYLRVLLAVSQRHGLPWAIYGDRHSALHRNDSHWQVHEVKAGRQDLTQIGQAMEELEVESIRALSAQAKGRVERLWRTLQDRLISEMRLAGISTLEQANPFLEKFVVEFNEKFAVEPANTKPAWRPVRDLDLERVCCLRTTAIVGRDNTVRFDGRLIDLDPPADGKSRQGKKATIRVQLDGRVLVDVDGETLADRKAEAPVRALPRRRQRVEDERPTPQKTRRPAKKSFKQALRAIRGKREEKTA